MSTKESPKKKWTRPEDAGPYPREWDRFEGQKPMHDGRVPTFWIRDLTPDLEEAAVEQMKTHYIGDEVVAQCSGTANDPESLAEWETIWREVLRERVSLAAFTDWPDGRENLVGLNILGVELPGAAPYELKGKCNVAGCKFYYDLMATVDPFERYGVRSFMHGLGLSVRRDFRGQGVGLHLLRAREPLCAALRLPLTVTAFSGAQSQTQARRAGFEVLSSRRYDDFALETGERPLKDARWTHMEIQAKFYGPREDEPRQ